MTCRSLGKRQVKSSIRHSAAMSLIPASLSSALNRLDGPSVVDECERLEQEAASCGEPHVHALAHMVGLLLCDDLTEARFLYLRLGESERASCQTAWRLVRALIPTSLMSHNSQPDTFTTTINNPLTPQPPEIATALGHIADKMHRRAIRTVTKAYDVLTRNQLAKVMAKSTAQRLSKLEVESDDLVKQNGWSTAKDDDNFIIIESQEREGQLVSDSSMGRSVGDLWVDEQHSDIASNGGAGQNVYAELESLTEQLVRLQTT